MAAGDRENPPRCPGDFGVWLAAPGICPSSTMTAVTPRPGVPAHAALYIAAALRWQARGGTGRAGSAAVEGGLMEGGTPPRLHVHAHGSRFVTL